MSAINDGGPAFPQPCTDSGHAANSPYAVAGGGLSLRDYFAAAALTGIMLADERARVEMGRDRRYSTAGEFASAAFETADAMLAARGGAS